MERSTRLPLQIVLNMNEVEDLKRYRKMYNDEIFWQNEFEVLYKALNRKFATTKENLVYFSLNPFSPKYPERNVGFRFGLQGGHRDDMITCHSNTQERCFIWSMFIMPKTCEDCPPDMIYWGEKHYDDIESRKKIADYVMSHFPELIATMKIKK
jgi:hypothetical protein